MKRQLLMLTSLVVLLACLSAQAFGAEITVRGRLAQTVEAGGWLINTSTQKYLILNVERFQNEKWFASGAEVEATGNEQRGAITIYQEGIPLEVKTMRPLASGAASTDAASGASGANASIISPLPTRVLVTGEAIVSSPPDTAIVVLAVITRAKTALDAQRENASLSEGVVRAVKAAAGTGAEVKTSGYNLQPQTVYQDNKTVITGYETRNSVTVTMSDLTKVGALIDTATAAGANNVDSLSFTLRQDRSARNQALTEATRAAVGKAQVMAQALGGRVVRILEVQEANTVVRPLYQTESFKARAADAGAQTPIEVGALDIRSQVQLVAEVETVK